MSQNGRQTQYQVSNTLRKSFSYADGTISAGESFPAALPSGALVTSVYALITTPFSAGATLTVGTNNTGTVGTSYNNLATIAATTAGAATFPNTGAAAVGPVVGDTSAYLLLQGTAATAGAGIAVIHYIANNDG